MDATAYFLKILSDKLVCTTPDHDEACLKLCSIFYVVLSDFFHVDMRWLSLTGVEFQQILINNMADSSNFLKILLEHLQQSRSNYHYHIRGGTTFPRDVVVAGDQLYIVIHGGVIRPRCLLFNIS